MWSERFCPFNSLLVLPFTDQFRISAEENIRNFPSVEFRWSGVYRRGEQTVLKAVAQC